MAIGTYTQFKDPQVDVVDRKQLDKAAATLIGNDLHLLPQSGIKPSIWCCRWYNTILNDFNRESYCYKKGDAVWINTENPTQFAIANQVYIRAVCESNSELTRQLQLALAGSTSEQIEFYRKVAVGEITASMSGLPLYYLGNLKQPAQIRVSLVDNNDTLPTNDDCWKDFFVSEDTTKFKNAILSCFRDQLSGFLQTHMDEYHLSGIQSWWRSKSMPGEISAQYLLKTLENATKYQEYSPNAGTIDEGFDYVVYYHQMKSSIDSNAMKWFRVWKSGYLEHGGIVSKNKNVAESLGDSLTGYDADGNLTSYKVNFNWSYGLGVAPGYTYPMALDEFYFEGDTIDFGNGKKIQLEDQGEVLDPSDRYQIQVTPVMMSETKQPYSTLHPSSGSQSFGCWYMTREVNTICNNSFRFIIDPDVQYYSYSTSGFSKNSQQGF